MSFPSPLNGERVRARGEPTLDGPNFLSAWRGELASLARCFPDAGHAPANPPKWSRAPSAGLSAGNSKTAVSECYAFSDKHRAPRPLPGVPGIHAGCRPIPDCNAPRRNKNPERGGPFRVVAGICRPRNGGRAELPTIFSPPTWIFYAVLWRWRENSPLSGLSDGGLRFKCWFAFSPLALDPSPR